MKFNFEKLDVYQDAIEFTNNIYIITKPFPKSEMFGITNQMRRASVSIPNNIAEGSSRGKKEFIHFLNIALGSAYECVPLLEISKRQGYFGEKIFNGLVEELHKIAAKINALKNSLRK